MKNGSAPNGNGTRWHDKYPHLGTDPLPADVFTSEEQFERERERIFQKVWLNVGRVEQVPHPGDYFVKDLAVCNTSVIVVRGKDGAVKAFHNMCSHRGNKIAWDTQGTCRMFTCKFHGWSYALDGKLAFVPDEERFFGLKKETLGMTPVAVDVWAGFIFINVDPNPQETLRDYLGELGAGLSDYPFGELSATSTSWTTEVKANWKVIKDAFQEVYHIAFLHKRSIPDSFTSKANPYAHCLDVQLYPRHGSMSLYGNADLKPTPVAELAFRHGAFVIRKDFSESRLPPAVNPTRSKEWTLDLNVIFPAFFVDVSEGSYFTHQFMPLAVDRTIWTSTQYFPKAKSPAQQFSQEYGNVIFRDVILEDGRTFEETQSVLSSGAKKEFHLHDEEILVRHSHHVIDQMLNGRPINAASRANEKGETARV
jgi:phenylpropionate dioxygenase-like ring-hydroxylating dioxygenase large terminal subunit